MYRHGLLLGELISRLCNSSPGITREHRHKQMHRRKSSLQRLGVLLLLAVVGCGSYSVAYALQGPASVNEGIKLWLDADKSYLFNKEDCTGPISASKENVKCWKDRSDNGAHVTIKHTNPSKNFSAPTYLEDRIGGQPALEFNRASESPKKDGLINWLGSEKW
ncbi:uncharacterized protein METZ01_LOCUS196062, partial [marine metagenome]